MNEPTDCEDLSRVREQIDSPRYSTSRWKDCEVVYLDKPAPIRFALTSYYLLKEPQKASKINYLLYIALI